MAPHSSTLAWKIPWTEKPGRLQSMGSLRVGHDWESSLFTFMHWWRKWQPTPVFLPGESQGWGSLVGCHLWGGTELDTTAADRIESLERTHTYVDKIDSRGGISSSGETVGFSIKLTQLAIHRKKVKLDLLFMLNTKIIISDRLNINLKGKIPSIWKSIQEHIFIILW